MIPKITIITPVLNGRKTIERTIVSVLEQDYRNIEYIVIDGGSTDGTLDIMDDYRNGIDILINEKDRGIYDAMNKGLAAASGDIIGIINSDDWYAKGALETVSAEFMSGRYDVVYGDMNVAEDNGIIKQAPHERLRTLWRQMAVLHPASFVKKSVYLRYGKFNDSYTIAADFEFMNRIWRKGARFKYINKLLAFFSRGGVSSKGSDIQKREVNRIIDTFFDGALFADACRDLFCGKTIPFFIWGAGFFGSLVSKAFIENGIPVNGFIDVSPEKAGKEINGIRIYKPQDLTDECIILVSVVENEKEICDAITNGERASDRQVIGISDCFIRYENELAKAFGEIL